MNTFFAFTPSGRATFTPDFGVGTKDSGDLGAEFVSTLILEIDDSVMVILNSLANTVTQALGARILPINQRFPNFCERKRGYLNGVR
jgi:hypothetical protein